MKPTAKFTLQDAQRAADDWGANCGPGAIAAVLDTTLDAIRPMLGDFEKKHYTNPTLMMQILNNLGADWHKFEGNAYWPQNGLVRVQWEGPWTEPGQSWQACQRHTHWVASRQDGQKLYIFDINCICVGGWVDVMEWSYEVVPWLLAQVEPEANGKWYPTHKIGIGPQA